MFLGEALIALGLFAYLVLSEPANRSFTALIPTFFGIPMLVLGIMARKEDLRKHMMHAAAALGLLGILGTASGLIKFPAYFTDQASLERPNAVLVQGIMCLLCILFLVLCVRSFIAARKAQAAA